MDTQWGLDLDMSAVRLMRRVDDTWREEAIEKIDSPDIEQRLEALVAPIANDGPVTLFLPRDQILYTQVELDASTDPQRQIEHVMEGRTPYDVAELSIDWEAGTDDSVMVAAIARDTLDEAAAFAEVRNLAIGGYSTLFSGDDFPRLPSFDGPNLAKETPPAPVPFATARVPSRPPEASIAAASAAATAKARFTPVASETARANTDPKTPVVKVEDTAPVVRVKAPQVPLDPGLPIAAPNAPPRVRTDIAAASVSGHAASLTPPGGSVRVRKTYRPLGTLAVFAAVLLLTVGIAVLVWNVLPMRPSTTADAPVDTGALPEAVVEQEVPPTFAQDTSEIASVPTTTDADGLEDVLEAETAAPLEQIWTDNLASPSLDTEFAAPTRDSAPALSREAQRVALLAPDPLPSTDATPPELVLPTITAAVETSAPTMAAVPVTFDTSESIFVSAFEIPSQLGDAIALPDLRQMQAGALPNVTGEAVPVEADPPVDPVASAVAQALEDVLTGPAGLIPTDLARDIPADVSPRARPDQFTDRIERQQFGGRTRAELARLLPPPRPQSVQDQALASASPPSALAVATSINPRGRPSNIAALVTAARVQAEAARVTATATVASPNTSAAIEAALQSDTEPQNRAVRPRQLSIPTTASVARQATIENAIRLNRVNLVGVYGAPSDRRALVRLSSGRYVKVKVGDRVDGGTVAQITDSELYYRKGNRTLSLAIPQG